MITLVCVFITGLSYNTEMRPPTIFCETLALIWLSWGPPQILSVGGGFVRGREVKVVVGNVISGSWFISVCVQGGSCIWWESQNLWVIARSYTETRASLTPTLLIELDRVNADGDRKWIGLYCFLKRKSRTRSLNTSPVHFQAGRHEELNSVSQMEELSLSYNSSSLYSSVLTNVEDCPYMEISL